MSFYLIKHRISNIFTLTFLETRWESFNFSTTVTYNSSKVKKLFLFHFLLIMDFRRV